MTRRSSALAYSEVRSLATDVRRAFAIQSIGVKASNQTEKIGWKLLRLHTLDFVGPAASFRRPRRELFVGPAASFSCRKPRKPLCSLSALFQVQALGAKGSKRSPSFSRRVSLAPNFVAGRAGKRTTRERISAGASISEAANACSR